RSPVRPATGDLWGLRAARTGPGHRGAHTCTGAPARADRDGRGGRRAAAGGPPFLRAARVLRARRLPAQLPGRARSGGDVARLQRPSVARRVRAGLAVVDARSAELPGADGADPDHAGAGLGAALAGTGAAVRPPLGHCAAVRRVHLLAADPDHHVVVVL